MSSHCPKSVPEFLVEIYVFMLLTVCLMLFICLPVQGYLRALGQTRTAQVKRDARMGEAEAKRDTTIKVV